MIYHVSPLNSTSLRPFVPNLSAVSTSQLGLNTVYIQASGVCFITLPLTTTVDNTTADVIVICQTSDANVSILPSGTDVISTPSAGLVTSSGSPLNFSGLGSVYEIKVAEQGLWFAVGNNLG